MADDDGFVTAYATPSVHREPTQADVDARAYLLASERVDGVFYEVDVDGHGRPRVFQLFKRDVLAGATVGTEVDHQDRANYWEAVARELRAKKDGS